MKKAIITAVIAVAVFIAAVVGIKVLLFPSDSAGTIPDSSEIEDVTEIEELLTEEKAEETSSANETTIDSENVMKTYSNGMATFTYDSSKLYFDEIPSDNENGIPLTCFLPYDTEESLPRLDIMPLDLTEPFTSDMPASDWESLVKALVLAYYDSESRENVQITLGEPIIKIDGNNSKMYLRVSCTLPDEPDYSFDGAVRLVSQDTKAVVTLALVKQGSEIPQEMKDTYMSAAIN